MSNDRRGGGIERPRWTVPGYLVATLAPVLLSACGGDDPTSPGEDDGTPATSVASVQVVPASDTLTAVGDTLRFRATAIDGDSNEMTGVSFTWSSSDPDVVTVDDDGLARAVEQGSVEITATAREVDGTADLTVDQATRGLAFRTQPSNATAGQTLDPAVQVAALDARGNVVTDAESPVTVTLEEGDPDPASVLHGTVTVDAVDGVATFSDLRVERAGTGYRLAATAGRGGDRTRSASFDVRAADAARLEFVTQPGDLEGQEPIRPAVQVEVRDEFGNRVTDGSTEVSLRLDEDPTAGLTTLSYRGATVNMITVPASDGVATFEDVSLDVLGDGYRFRAEAPGLPGRSSEAFSVYLTFASVSTGGRHRCGVTTSNHAYCWGDNSWGELGDSTTTSRDLPVPVARGLAFETVSAGFRHTCGVTVGGSGYCWGYGGSGRLGTGSSTSSSIPLAVSGALSFSTISAGFTHTCGVTTGAEVFCWGDNPTGQLGDGTDRDRDVPVAVASGIAFTAVATGTHRSCAISAADAAYCWGSNQAGLLGVGTSGDQHTPAPVVGGIPFGTVDLGTSHICGVATGGDAYCWGIDGRGALGNGAAGRSDEPMEVAGTFAFGTVTAGNGHTCGVTSTGEAYCWGSNDRGQLGDGTSTDRQVPTRVIDDHDYAGMSAGTSLTCGVTVDGVARCWGSTTESFP